MVTKGTIPLKKIWKMLDNCAPGWKKKKKIHNWSVLYNGRTYPRLPLGEHGTRPTPPIEIGHVRQMVRFFEIEDCARGKIPALR